MTKLENCIGLGEAFGETLQKHKLGILKFQNEKMTTKDTKAAQRAQSKALSTSNFVSFVSPLCPL
jgi:hypothetical protein